VFATNPSSSIDLPGVAPNSAFTPVGIIYDAAPSPLFPNHVFVYGQQAYPPWPQIMDVPVVAGQLTTPSVAYTVGGWYGGTVRIATFGPVTPAGQVVFIALGDGVSPPEELLQDTLP